MEKCPEFSRNRRLLLKTSLKKSNLPKYSSKTIKYKNTKKKFIIKCSKTPISCPALSIKNQQPEKEKSWSGTYIEISGFLLLKASEIVLFWNSSQSNISVEFELSFSNSMVLIGLISARVLKFLCWGYIFAFNWRARVAVPS